MAERLVVEDAYPIELFGLVERDETRYGNATFWASAESMSGTEFLTIGFKSPCYFNNITFKIAQKPCNIEMFVSDDNATWTHVLGRANEELSYLISSWGGTSAIDSLLQIELDTKLTSTKFLKFTFERIEVALPNGGAAFPYSIDVADMTINHIVESPADYPFTEGSPHTYEDIFANHVSSSLGFYGAGLATDGATNTYWMSQANVISDAVEYLCFDVSDTGAAVSIDAIDLDPVFGGCQMNVYFSGDSATSYEDKEWEPLPNSYSVTKGLLRIPTVKAKYIKLEFTKLVAVPYTIAVPGQKVLTRRFPAELQHYFDLLGRSDAETDDISKLLYTPEDVARKLVGQYGYDTIGVSDPERAVAVTDSIREERLNTGIPDTFPDIPDTQMYQFDLTENIADADSLFGLSGITVEADSFESELIPYEITANRCRFFQSGIHDYLMTYEMRSQKVAYVVGIRGVKFYLFANSETIEGEPFVETFAQPRMTHANTWTLSGSKIVASSSPVVYGSNAFSSLRKFRAFQFAAQQKRPSQFLGNGTFESEPVSSGQWVPYQASGETVSLVWDDNGVAIDGLCLRVNRNGGGAAGGAQSQVLPVVAGGTAKVQGSIFLPEESHGDWVVAALDSGGAPIHQKYIYPSLGKWTDFEMSYKPQPYGGWWSADYGYRQQITIDATTNGIAAGTAVFVSVDTHALEDAGKVRADRQDWRVAYFDGLQVVEIARDHTDTAETWFKIQDDIEPNRSNYGYFLYYGHADEATSPLSSLSSVFEQVTTQAPIEYGGNSTFSLRADMSAFLGDGAGSIVLKYTPKFDPDVDVLKDGDVAIRYIASVATVSGGRVDLYCFQNYLFVRFYEHPDESGNSFQSAISCPLDALSEDTEYTLIADWGLPSSSGSGLRRDMAVYINGTEQTENTEYYSLTAPLGYDDVPLRKY
jgi:hypothetical protein